MKVEKVRNDVRTIVAAFGLALLIGFSVIASSAQAVCPGDADCDGILDVADRCTLDSRNAAAPCDTDQDGYGNVCDGDFDQNMATNSNDLTMYFTPAYQSGVPSATGTDMNCNGVFEPDPNGPNGIDYELFFLPNFNSTGKPGPSGLACAGTVPCN